MTVHMLMVNARGTSWDYIPNELWRSILFRFAVPSCNGISFETIQNPGDVGRLEAFSEHKPHYLRNDQFKPYSCPMDCHDPESHMLNVAVFEFSEWIARLISQTDFNAWHASNAGSDVDELVFWNDSDIKLHAIPYEGQAYFHNLTGTEKRLLIDSDARVESNLYAV